VAAFEDGASPEDLAAVMTLESWTNDRLVTHRLGRARQVKMGSSTTACGTSGRRLA
jgi:hypothetical protein